ncbi:MAG: TRAP transporter large permease subunit [Hyphomicrobiaceae bacterium]
MSVSQPVGIAGEPSAGAGRAWRAEYLSAPGRATAAVANAFAWVATGGIVFMTLATAYDVLARYIFNKPTDWATEISTYVLIGIIFIGAAYTHLAEGNVRVHLLLDRLSEENRRRLCLVTAWIGLLYVAVAGWQAVLMTLSDYTNGARIFSLLLTPTWIPKAPIAVGLIALAVAILVEIERLSPAAPQQKRWAPYVIFTGLAGWLLFLGPHPALLPGTAFDLGSIAVLVAVIAGSFYTNGARIGVAVLGIIAGSIAAFLLGKALGAGMLTLLLAVAIIFYLVIGVRIAFALAIVGMLAIYFLTPKPFPVTLPDRAWSGVNSFSLTAVPLYVLMGALLVRSGLSGELFSVMARLLSRLPGGLAHAATAGCAVFAAVSGSSVATAATIGTVACPEMIRRGYSEKLTYGGVAAGGTLGILIPPSVPMIIYATTVGVPIVKLFIAGIVPGIIMMLTFMAVIFMWAVIYPSSAPTLPPEARPPLTRQSAIDSGLVVALIGLVIFSLYAGLATASETGALGAFVAFLICLLRGRMSRQALVESLFETVVVTSFIFLIVVGANIITFGFDYLKISQKIMAAATDTHLGRWFVFGIIMLIYVVLGAFLDSISMIVLTLPIVFPVIQSLGFDPIWFGVVLVIMAEVGLIHPPIGMNLFVLQGIGRGVSLRTIALGAVPFLAAMGFNVILLCLFPELVLWLPTRLE